MGTRDNGTSSHQIREPAPVSKAASTFDGTVKILPVVLGVLSAICLGILYLADKPSEAKVRQMIEDKTGPNIYRIERLEKAIDNLEARIDRAAEERSRENRILQGGSSR